MKFKREQLGFFILRFGLGLFLLLWGFDKIFSPESTVKIFEMFYFTGITVNSAYIIGALEIVLSIAILVGFQKKYSYGLGLLLHGVSTLSTLPQLISPFGKNHLFIAGLPVLAGFVALYMFRDRDKLWSVDK